MSGHAMAGDVAPKTRATGTTAAPAVHVVIVNWNCEHLLLRCLDALAAQTIRPTHVTVVDNDSARFDAAAVHAQYPFVTCLRLPTNVGFARANNLAIAMHRDVEWTWLLNPDAFADRDCLARLLAAAVRHPDAACFGARLERADDRSRLDGAGDVYHISGIAWRRGHNQPSHGRYLEVEEVFSSCAAAALYRTCVLCDVGGFDEDFESYVDDVDLGFRMRLAGYRSLYVPDAVVSHIGSASTAPQSDVVFFYGHRNLVWCFVQNMPGAAFWLLLPCHVAMNLYSLVYYAARGHGRVVWAAKRAAIRGLARAWEKRRRVQAARRAPVLALWRAMTKRPTDPVARVSRGAGSGSVEPLGAGAQADGSGV